MKSKIEIGKLGTLGKVLGNDEFAWVLRELNIIIEKQNEIIDYLNSQSQPEEKTFPIDNTGGTMFPVEGEIKPMSKKEWEEFQKEIQDTPEEWEKELKEDVEIIKVLDDYDYHQLITKVRQLLYKREREVGFSEEELETLRNGLETRIDEYEGTSLNLSTEEILLEKILKLLNSKKK